MGWLDELGEFVRSNETVQKLVVPIIDDADAKVKSFFDQGDAVFGTGNYENATPQERLKRIVGLAEAAQPMAEAQSGPVFGDIIAVARRGYEHFGVYLDDRRVIHYTGNKREPLQIRRTTLRTFLGQRKRFEILDFPRTRSTPGRRKVTAADFASLLDTGLLNDILKSLSYRVRSPEETVERAESRLGEEHYDLAACNCEHFAIWCKTGISESRQVDRVLQVLNRHPVPISV